MKYLKPIALTTILVFSVLPAYAHEEHPGHMKTEGMGGMEGKAMPPMMGTHDMAGKVTAVDPKTGLITVDSAGLVQHLHFPAVSDLKVGDSITLHLSYSKP